MAMEYYVDVDRPKGGNNHEYRRLRQGALLHTPLSMGQLINSNGANKRQYSIQEN